MSILSVSGISNPRPISYCVQIRDKARYTTKLVCLYVKDLIMKILAAFIRFVSISLNNMRCKRCSKVLSDKAANMVKKSEVTYQKHKTHGINNADKATKQIRIKNKFSQSSAKEIKKQVIKRKLENVLAEPNPGEVIKKGHTKDALKSGDSQYPKTSRKKTPKKELKALSYDVDHLSERFSSAKWARKRFGKDLVVPGINKCARNVKEMWIDEKLPTNLPQSILEKIKNRAIPKSLPCKDGVCRGITVYFNSELLKKPLTEKNIIHIAKQLKDGASAVSMVTQAYGLMRRDFQICTTMMFSVIRGKKANWKDSESFLKKIDSLDNGVYHLSHRPVGENLVGHAINFIKLSRRLAFVYDSNVGLIRLQDRTGKTGKIGTKLDYILKGYKQTNAEKTVLFFDKVDRQDVLRDLLKRIPKNSFDAELSKLYDIQDEARVKFFYKSQSTKLKDSKEVKIIED